MEHPIVPRVEAVTLNGATDVSDHQPVLIRLRI